jgi:succinoglycan biosynthesis protein ExoL
MKITFLLPVLSQARYHKRIIALDKLGIQPNILAFEREYYPGKPWPGGYRSLGHLQHGHYYKRLVPFVKALLTVRSAAKESDVIYAFGLDILLLGWLASRTLDKRPKIIYEVGDIRAVLIGRSLLSRGLRWLERYLLRSVDVLVTTSEAFITGYFQGVQGLTDLCYQVIENKLDGDVLPQPKGLTAHNGWSEILRIGCFGLIRCHRSWEVLKRAVERGNGRVQVYVRGVSMGLENLEEEAQRLPYIEYGGPYVVPDDLPAMYGQVDMVWAAHHHGETNFRWARANRFYEACYFKRPLFGQVGTLDGQIIEEWGLGACVDLLDVEGAVDRILRISEVELAQWRKNVAQLPKEVYIYTGEHERLIEAIQ